MSFRSCLALTLFPFIILCNTLSYGQKSSSGSSQPATYALRYKLQPGEQLISKVVHLAETRTKMSEHEEASSSRTISEKVWDVASVNDQGDMTFEYRINSVELAQQVGDGQELRYSSLTDTVVPEMFKQVAATVAKPLATVTISSQGQVLNRESDLKSLQLGMGELTLPLPAEALAIGGQWDIRREVRLKLESGAYKTILVRDLYTLEKVSSGVATIRIETQPLTPVNNQALQSQLIQQLSEGEIKFDLDNGRMLSKHLNWSKEVLGFRGPETSLRYNAKFTEELLPQTKRTASRR